MSKGNKDKTATGASKNANLHKLADKLGINAKGGRDGGHEDQFKTSKGNKSGSDHQINQGKKELALFDEVADETGLGRQGLKREMSRGGNLDPKQIEREMERNALKEQEKFELKQESMGANKTEKELTRDIRKEKEDFLKPYKGTKNMDKLSKAYDQAAEAYEGRNDPEAPGFKSAQHNAAMQAMKKVAPPRQPQQSTNTAQLGQLSAPSTPNANGQQNGNGLLT